MDEFWFCKTSFFREHARLFIPSLNAILFFVPANRKFLLCLFRTYENSNQWSKAQQVLEKILALAPNNLDSRWMLGMWLLSQGKPSEAMIYLEHCVNHWDNEKNQFGLANAYAVLSICYQEQGKFDQAENLLAKTNLIAPWDLDACLSTISLYTRTNRGEQIPQLLNNYIQSYPYPYLPYGWMAHHFHFYLNTPQQSLE